VDDVEVVVAVVVNDVEAAVGRRSSSKSDSCEREPPNVDIPSSTT
jgi:hypothetical protein